MHKYVYVIKYSLSVCYGRDYQPLKNCFKLRIYTCNRLEFSVFYFNFVPLILILLNKV